MYCYGNSKDPCNLVLPDLLAARPPHMATERQANLLEEYRHSLVNDSDKVWARFVLETVLWAQRQQRQAKNDPSDASDQHSGRFAIISEVAETSLSDRESVSE